MIELKNITYSYQNSIEALSGINLRINAGGFFAVLGANGTGKTTLMNLIAGLIFANSGDYFFKNVLITEKALKDKDFNSSFRRSIGYVFQNSDVQLFNPTVFDELIFGPLQLGMDEETASKRALDVMEMLGIGALKDRSTLLLSGGEKKKIVIGSILTYNPEVILIDEPMNDLDPRSRSSIAELLYHLKESGKTIVISTHDLELVSHLQPQVAVLSENKSIERIGSTEEILSDIDFLKQVNLIHESIHRHGEKIHKHVDVSHWFHKHQNGNTGIQ